MRKKKLKICRICKRIIVAIVYPIIDSIGDTIELVLVCIIIAAFRFIITGKLIRYDIIETVIYLVILSTIVGAEMYLLKKNTIFDTLLLGMNKLFKLMFYTLSFFAICFM